jgi:hypothetical protein
MTKMAKHPSTARKVVQKLVRLSAGSEEGGGRLEGSGMGGFQPTTYDLRFSIDNLWFLVS